MFYYVRAVPVMVLGALVLTGTAFAVTSSSPNYQLIETEFNSGSSTHSCSQQYCAEVTVGSDMKGQTHAVFDASINMDEPFIEVIIEVADSNLGTLSTTTTATKTTLVKVRNNLTRGYVLQIVGNPPHYNGHTLATSLSPIASLPGTEQFGINVVANTSPSVGAHPVQVPADGLVYGEPAEGYDVPNQFKYESGAVVARSTADSGRTDYTISMIVNISSATPAGHYSGDFATIIIPSF